MQIDFISNDPIDQLLKNFITSTLNDNNDNKHTVSLNSLIIKLSTKKLTLIQLLKEMENYIVSTNEIYRNRSCLLLYEILDRVKDLKLNLQEYKSLYEFFLSKMQDLATTLEAVKSIYLMIKKNNETMPKLCPDEYLFEEFYKVLNDKHFHTPAYEQEIRYYIYKILQHFIIDHSDLCIKKDIGFILTIMNAVEGEKDPRNLMITFKLIDFLLNNFDFKIKNKNILDDLFEGVSCYFPITFNPPENDQFHITQQDLKRELNLCLCNVNFIKNTFDLIYEKINASQLETKLACLETLENMISRNHDNPIIQENLNKIWSNIKKVYHEDNGEELDDLIIKIAKKFSIIIDEAYNYTGIVSTSYSSILTQIQQDCFDEIINGCTTRIGLKSFNLILGLTQATKPAAKNILNEFTALFCLNYNISKPNESQIWLEYLYKLVDIWTKTYQISDNLFKNIEDNNFLMHELLYTTLNNKLYQILQNTLTNENSKILALKIYSQLINISLKANKDVNNNIALLLNYYEQKELSSLMRNCLVDALAIITSNFEIKLSIIDDVINKTINKAQKILLLSNQIELEFVDKVEYVHNDLDSLFYGLNIFAKNKSHSQEIFELMIQALKDQLENNYNNQNKLLIIAAIFKSIRQILESIGNTQLSMMSKINLWQLLYKNHDISLENKDIAKQKEINRELHKLVNLLSEQCVQEFKTILTKKDFLEDLLLKTNNNKYILNKVNHYIVYSLSSLSSTSNEVNQIYKSICEILKNLEMNVMISATNSIRKSKILFILSNRNSEDKTSEDLLVYLFNHLKEQTSLIIPFASIMKGLVLKNSNLGIDYMNKLFKFINDNNAHESLILPILDQAFEILLRKYESSQYKLTIKPTFRQRMFSVTYQYIYQKLNELKEMNDHRHHASTYKVYLKIILRIMLITPYAIMKNHTAELMPIILNNMSSFDVNDEQNFEIMEYSIKFICNLIKEKYEMEKYFDSIIDIILKILNYLKEDEKIKQSKSYIDIFDNCLKSLVDLSKYPYYLLSKYKKQVMKCLRDHLDNKKRMLRKSVVNCINIWSLITQSIILFAYTNFYLLKQLNKILRRKSRKKIVVQFKVLIKFV